jgi:hypothetical protein
MVTLENIENNSMTDETYKQIAGVLRTHRVKEAYSAADIEQFSAQRVHDIRVAIQSAIIPELYGAKHSASTGMCPCADGYWVIGSFGSVWLDVVIDDRLLRIHLMQDAGGGKCQRLDLKHLDTATLVFFVEEVAQ